MNFIPEMVDGAVVLNAANNCAGESECRLCADIATCIHNWMVSQDMEYLIIDFMDEKDICPEILIEILQLRKRLPHPFLFVGLTKRPMAVLHSYAYSDHPVFAGPEDAVAYLRRGYADLLDLNISNIVFGSPIVSPLIRNRAPEADTEEAAL